MASSTSVPSQTGAMDLATSACATPLSANSAPCDTDPLWSRYYVTLKQSVNQADRQQVIDRHRALGVETFFVYNDDILRSYDGIIPPAIREAIRSDASVEKLLTVRAPNIEDKYGTLLDLPSVAPTTTSDSILWDHGDPGVSQKFSTDPAKFSELTHKRNFPNGDGSTMQSSTTVALKPVAGSVPLMQDSPTAASSISRVRYKAQDDSFLIEAQPVADSGMRFLVQLNSRAAPSSFDFDLSLPPGTKLEPAANDGALLLGISQGNADPPLGMFDPPLAFDAHGRKVPVRQYFEPNRVRLVLDLSDVSITFPVIADPSYESITCLLAGIKGDAHSFLVSQGWCPYGITFFHAHVDPNNLPTPMRGYWPKKAKVHPNGTNDTYRNVSAGGQSDKCSWVPEEVTGVFNFEVSCRMHDYGYDLIRVRTPFNYDFKYDDGFTITGPGVTKFGVDSQFLLAMDEHCGYRDPIERKSCRDVAGAYHFGVAAMFWNPTDAKQRPEADWPRPYDFLQNRDFSLQTTNWEAKPVPDVEGAKVSYGTLWRSQESHILRFHCVNTFGGCSVFQEISPEVSKNLHGEKLHAQAYLRCSSDGGCPYTFTVHGLRRHQGELTWETLAVESSNASSTPQGNWHVASLPFEMFPSGGFEMIRWQLYNNHPSKLLDFRDPRFVLDYPVPSP